MTIQHSVAVANGRLDSIETIIGTSPKLRLYSGAPPANCAAARTGTLLVEMSLPSDWLAAGSGGSKVKAGTWSGTGTAGAAGGTNAGHYAIMDNAGTTCHQQGTVTIAAGGGDMVLDNVSISTGQVVTVSTYSLTDGNQ